MQCLDERTALAILDATIDRDELVAVSAHLDGCAYCRALVAAIGRSDGADESPPELTALEPGTQIGKFVVERELGAGASGAVYAVRDPELDREVALKLLHYRGEAHSPAHEEMLLKEARTMAKLSHPNLVPIYEVGRWEDSVYVAMELIAGGTLRDWLAADHGDPLPVVIGAGRGLAAAHDAGLVHRDFKPENILVGTDGRARVTDFGLAGTPAYMAPEQLRGVPTDARGDQFSFCVVLYEALAGKRPFAGATIDELRAALAAPPPSLRVSCWPVLARGLAADPAQRFPDMHAVLAALAPRSRRRVAIAGAAVLAAALVATTALIARSHDDPCAPVAIGAWNPLASAVARSAFLRTGSPIAAATFERTAAALDRYAVAWTAEHTEACTATRIRHDASDALLDRRTRCLADRRAEVAAIAGELARATPATVEQAPAAIAALPAPATCEAPDGDRDPITGPDATALRDRLDRATALAGFDVAARTAPELAAIIQRAAELHMPRLRAAALTTRGFVRMTARDDAGAVTDLEEAAYAAEANKLDRLAARASTALISAATDAGDLTRARAAVRPGDAAVTRLGPGGDERSELAARIAWLELHEGNLAGAETDARAAISDGCRGEVATLATCAHFDVLATVLFSAGKLPEALELYRKNLALTEQQFGPQHPKTARAVERVANTLDKLGRHGDALAMYDRALAITGDAATGAVATLYDNSGTALMMLGKLPAAEARIRRALALHEQVQGKDHPDVATTLVNLANVLDREGHDSLALRQRALRMFEAKLPADHPLIAATLATIGYHYVVVKQPDAAIGYLERAAAIQAARLGTNHPDYAYTLALLGSAQLDVRDPGKAAVTLQQALDCAGTDASARPDIEFNLAAALWRSHGDRAKARALVQAAFAANPDPEFKRWLATH
jgi:tetratricopeptide (TPR) repeat protein